MGLKTYENLLVKEAVTSYSVENEVTRPWNTGIRNWVTSKNAKYEVIPTQNKGGNVILARKCSHPTLKTRISGPGNVKNGQKW